jgi:hypothetical protein
MKKFLVFLTGFWLCGAANADIAAQFDETEVARGAGLGEGQQHRSNILTAARITTIKGDETRSSLWFGLRASGLRAMWDENHESYQLQYNANLATLLNSQNSFLKKLQLELGTAHKRPTYGLLGYEVPVVSPVSLFIAGVHTYSRDKEYKDWTDYVRFIGGPIVYWRKSHTMFLFYPSSFDRVNQTDGAITMRTRVREFGEMYWFDVDLAYKVRDARTDEPVHRFGYGVTAGIWRIAASYRNQPLFDGGNADRKAFEVSYLYDM